MREVIDQRPRWVLTWEFTWLCAVRTSGGVGTGEPPARGIKESHCHQEELG